jgi:hypothetical protein
MEEVLETVEAPKRLSRSICVRIDHSFDRARQHTLDDLANALLRGTARFVPYDPARVLLGPMVSGEPNVAQNDGDVRAIGRQ